MRLDILKGSCLISFLFLFTACASIDYADYRQTILVLSDPPGAKVYDGERFIGVTPNYMRVRRGAAPRLRMEMPGGASREVRLKTKYRWGDSFGMNWLLLWGAPVGWVTDLSTGTAWEAQDPPLQTFGKGGVWPVITKPTRIAVAPPQGVDISTADALGMAIDEKLRSTEKFQVADYDDTSKSFQFYRSYAGLAQDRDNRYRLLSTIKVDHVLISTAEKRGDSFLVKAQLKDVITTKTKNSYTWEITPETQTLRDQFTAKTIFNEYVNLLPNTVFLNFATYRPSVTANGQQYAGKEAPANGLGDDMLRYISALSIAGLERERFNTRGHFTFSFVPTAIISQKEIVLPNYNAVNDTAFHRWFLSGGYGAEGGYMGRFGLAYVDVIPMFTWSRIRYSNSFTEGAVSRPSVQLMTEFGYSYFFTNHLIGRIYFRNVNEDNRLWNEALSEAAGTPQITNSVSSGFAGISIGYYIPTTGKVRGGWMVKKK